MKKVNRTALFLTLTFVISFLLAGCFRLFGGQYNTMGGTILAIVYMFIPMICVIIVEKVIHRKKLKENLFINFKINIWFLFAWLIPPVLSFLTLGVGLLFPDIRYSPEMAGMFERFEHMMTPEQAEQMRLSMETLPVHPVWITLLQGLVAGLTINALAGFGEELGWRGFLLKQFREMNFSRASLYIGSIWGIWHSPIILMGHNYPQHPGWGVLMMTAWCILLTPLFLYITIKSRSVIAAAIMHGTLNGTAGIAILLIEGGNDLTVGMTGLAGFTSLVFLLILLFVYDRYISRERIMAGRISSHL